MCNVYAGFLVAVFGYQTEDAYSSLELSKLKDKRKISFDKLCKYDRWKFKLWAKNKFKSFIVYCIIKMYCVHFSVINYRFTFFNIMEQIIVYKQN